MLKVSFLEEHTPRFHSLDITYLRIGQSLLPWSGRWISGASPIVFLNFGGISSLAHFLKNNKNLTGLSYFLIESKYAWQSGLSLRVAHQIYTYPASLRSILACFLRFRCPLACQKLSLCSRAILMAGISRIFTFSIEVKKPKFKFSSTLFPAKPS